jgi:hypothetical protein
MALDEILARRQAEAADIHQLGAVATVDAVDPASVPPESDRPQSLPRRRHETAGRVGASPSTCSRSTRAPCLSVCLRLA